MADSGKLIPEEDALCESIQQLKIDNPEWGIKSVYNEIVKAHENWQVSEKRVKKIMQTQGLTQTSSSNGGANSLKIVKSGVADDPSIPVSFIDPKLDFQSFSSNIMAKMVDIVTGKGLFAAKDIKKDDIIFMETPLVYFPPWEGFTLARTGEACGLCCKPFTRAVRMGVRCSHCDIMYCSKQCRTTAIETFHPLECPALNPHMRDFMNFCAGEQWQAPMAVARMYCHMMLAHQRGELETVLMHYNAFATVNQAERQAKETEWIFMEHPTRELWTKARAKLTKALHPPPKKCRINTPLPDDLANQLFNDEDTFLNYLGKFNINNQNGGMYLVHSHINHNCTPNVSIDYPTTQQTQYKLMVRAIRDIKKGEQLFESYVNPRWNKETRQNYLNKSYMFECQCERCNNDGPLTDELRKGLRLRAE